MTINRQHFREKMGSMPGWHCPRCTTGTLQELVKERVKVWPDWSKIERDEDWWDPDHSRFRFSAQMKCTNSQCGECVFVVGEMVPTYYGDGEEGPHYADDFRPQAAYPPIPVFKLNGDWPTSVTAELFRSFAPIWSDPGASANRLRTAVERLLDHLKVKKTTLVTKGGKARRSQLKTHDRIVAFRSTDPKAAGLLEAIKWLGNAGSHADLSGLSRDDVLDGMVIMEHVLRLLFDTTDATVTKLAKGINKKKGPVPKSKT